MCLVQYFILSDHLKKRITGFAVYTLFWLLLFILARIYFLVKQHDEASMYSIKILISTFIHGFSLDLSMTCYLLLIPLLASIPGLYFNGSWFRTFLKVYTFTLVLLITAVVVADAGIYSYWAFRLEYTSLEYIKHPGDAVASLGKGEVFSYIIPFLVLSSLLLYICNNLINKYFSNLNRVKPLIPGIVVFLVITAFQIIPIRGGIGTVPLNVSAAYFSGSLFPNHAAVNVIWNLGHTSIYKKPTKNPYQFKDPEIAKESFKRLLQDSSATSMVLKTDRPNIIIIILESFGSFLINEDLTDTIIIPRFQELIREGIYFSNIYATGSRTDKVIPAILSGYPNLPSLKVLQEPRKSGSLPGIIKLLDSAGYKTSFWYGGDLNFANLNSYILGSSFREIITMRDFSSSDYNSKWGVHDHVIFNRMQDSLARSKQPFAYTVLTLSSHEPFEVPMDPVFRGRDELSRFKNSAFYTDKSLGGFIDMAKKTDWWKNSLVVLIADHCRRCSPTIPVYSEEIFKIPMLWLGGALSVRDTVIHRIGNQYDLPLIIANQLNLDSKFPFSKDLLSPGSGSFAFYTYNEGFAFITDSATSIYDISLKNNVFVSGKNPSEAESLGKSFLQVLFDDYLRR